MTDTNTAAALSAEADGWIEWSGGENPAPGEIVEVRWSDGEVEPPRASENFPWQWRYAGRIIAYRVATPAPAALEGSSSGEGEAGDQIARLFRMAMADADNGADAEAVKSFRHARALELADDAFAYFAALHPSSAADAKPVGYACSRELRSRGPREEMITFRPAADAYCDTPLYAQPHPSQQAGAEGLEVPLRRVAAIRDALRRLGKGYGYGDLDVAQADADALDAILAALKPVEG